MRRCCNDEINFKSFIDDDVHGSTNVVGAGMRRNDLKSIGENAVSWPLIKLGDIVKNCSSKRIPLKQADRAERNGDYRYYGASGVIDYVDDYLFDGDYLLIGEDGNNLLSRSTPIAFHANGKFWVNNHAHVLSSNGKADLGFISYYINSINLEAYITGSAQPKLNKSNLEAIKVPLPPLDEKKRIAAILDKADAIRRKRQQAINLADDFLDMFGDPVTNPKGWEVKKFGDVIDVLTDYHANGSYKTLVKNVTLLDDPNYAYMVRTTDLEKKNYTDSVKYIDQHAYEHLAKSKVFGGEIIMNKIGSAGAVYLMPHLNKPVSLAMNQFMIRCNELSINEFMYYQLKTEAGAREISQRVQGAVTKKLLKTLLEMFLLYYHL